MQKISTTFFRNFLWIHTISLANCNIFYENLVAFSKEIKFELFGKVGKRMKPKSDKLQTYTDRYFL